jgi:hypothetical protein
VLLEGCSLMEGLGTADCVDFYREAALHNGIERKVLGCFSGGLCGIW